jgi:hypothetical protein
MPKFAADTEISVDKSQTELRKLLSRYGATNYVLGAVNGQIAVMFEVHARRVRFSMPMPALTDADRTKVQQYSHKRVPRSQSELRTVLDQKERQTWRILLLAIKAKFELIETGAVSFEDEFLPYTMLPTGQTVGEWIEPQMEHVTRHGEMPAMLPGLPVGAKVIPLGERSG